VASYNAATGVAWHENDEESFTERAITTNADGALSVFAEDFDEDGLVDVLSGVKVDPLGDPLDWQRASGCFDSRGDHTETPAEASRQR